MNKVENIQESKLLTIGLEKLRDDLGQKQKKGLPFIMTSVILWLLITIVTVLDLPLHTANILVFCCSCPLMPVSWMIGKLMKVDIFSKENPLGNLGFLFTCNQMIYLLIVMWVFREVPEKMIMVYAMVFGAHLLPFSWIYKSKGYMFFSIFLPIMALFLGTTFSSTILATTFVIFEIAFTIVLYVENRT